MKVASGWPRRSRVIAIALMLAAVGIASGLVVGLGGGNGRVHQAVARPSQRSVIGESEEGNSPGSVGTRSISPGGHSSQASNSPTSDGNPATKLAAQPCRLVTETEAEAILGTAIAPPRPAALGPSCLYLNGLSTISLSVQATSYASIRGRLQSVQQFSVAGQPVYCANLGEPMLFAPLDATSTLEVVAPCPIARGFAAAALPRLSDA